MTTVLVALALVMQPPPADTKRPPLPASLEAAADQYLEAWAKAERRASGMTLGHAAAARQASHKAIVARIGKAYGLTESQIGEAVKAKRKQMAAASPRAKAAAVASVVERTGRVTVGSVCALDTDAVVANSYQAISEAHVFVMAGDLAGLKGQVARKQVYLNDEAVGVRVLEVFDFTRIDKGHFARVRIQGGRNDGREAYCFPAQLDPDARR